MDGLYTRAKKDGAALLRRGCKLLLTERMLEGLEDLCAELRTAETPVEVAFAVSRHGPVLTPCTLVEWMCGIAFFSVLMGAQLAAWCMVLFGGGVTLVGGTGTLFLLGGMLNFITVPTALALFCAACFWGVVALGLVSGSSVLGMASLIWRGVCRSLFIARDKFHLKNGYLKTGG